MAAYSMIMIVKAMLMNARKDIQKNLICQGVSASITAKSRYRSSVARMFDEFLACQDFGDAGRYPYRHRHPFIAMA